MGFGKKDHLVGLDIGSAYIKVAELKISKSGRVLEKFGMARVAEGAIEDGRIMDMEAVSEAIRGLFKAQRIREKHVAISTGGNSVVIKTISTTKVPEKELLTTIRAEAEQYIPYDIDDVNIDYQILGESEFSPDQINVLIVAVKKDLVEEYMALIRSAGLVPSIIDVDTFALQNIYEILPETDPTQVTLLIDVGMSKMSLNILRDNTSMMVRDMMIGVHQILDAMAEQFGIDRSQAATILEDDAGTTVDEAALAEICRDVANDWCTEICEVVHTFESNSNDMHVEQVLLSGGGGFIEGFSFSLEAELEVPVKKINPFSGITLNSKNISDDMAKQMALQASIAMGLSLRRVDDK